MRLTQRTGLPIPASRPPAPFSSPPSSLVALVAVFRSIVFKHVSCASDCETAVLLPSPGKKTVKIGVMLKKFFVSVVALKSPWRRR